MSTSFNNPGTGTSLPKTPEYPGTLGLLMDVELPLMIRFGRTRMPLGQLKALSAGSVIDFGARPENAVELVVNGRVIARGVAVAVNGKYGVRVDEIVSARDGLAAESQMPAEFQQGDAL